MAQVWKLQSYNMAPWEDTNTSIGCVPSYKKLFRGKRFFIGNIFLSGLIGKSCKGGGSCSHHDAVKVNERRTIGEENKFSRQNLKRCFFQENIFASLSVETPHFGKPPPVDSEDIFWLFPKGGQGGGHFRSQKLSAEYFIVFFRVFFYFRTKIAR